MVHFSRRREIKFHVTKWKSDEKNVDTVEKNTVENNSGENNTKFLVRLTQTASFLAFVDVSLLLCCDFLGSIL